MDLEDAACLMRLAGELAPCLKGYTGCCTIGHDCLQRSVQKNSHVQIIEYSGDLGNARAKNAHPSLRPVQLALVAAHQPRVRVHVDRHEIDVRTRLHTLIALGC